MTRSENEDESGRDVVIIGTESVRGEEVGAVGNHTILIEVNN